MKTVVFDGHNALWRLQKKMPELSQNGKPVQVVFGFMRLLRSVLAQFEPDIAVVCFDSGRPLFRQKIYSGYKHGRHHDPVEESDLILQMKEIKKLLPAINVISLSYPNTEADDLVSIACIQLKGEKVIVSSDQDMLHLVSSLISVWSPIKLILYTKDNFRELTSHTLSDGTVVPGLSPIQWLEYRALVGDSGDGIPGVAKGFGEETARSLITRYGSLHALFEPKMAKRISKMGSRHALLYGEGTKEAAERNLKLMDLRSCMGVTKEAFDDIAKLLKNRLANRGEIDRHMLREKFKEYKFKTLLDDFARWVRPFEDLLKE